MNGDNLTYFGKSGVEHVPKETKKFLGNKNININSSKRLNSVWILFYWIYCFTALPDYTNLLRQNSTEMFSITKKIYFMNRF